MKKILSLFLALLFTVGTVVPVLATETTLTGANKRINTFINMAKGNEVTEAETSELSTDELRFLGIYLSNFFVPFKTEIGTAGESKDSVLQQNKEQMVSALQNKLAFSEDLANSLVEEILGLSRSSIAQNVNQMSYYVKDGSVYKKIPGINVSYYNFFELSVGRFDVITDTLRNIFGIRNNPRGSWFYPDLVGSNYHWYGSYTSPTTLTDKEDIKLLEELYYTAGKYKKVYMGYGSDENVTVVADFSVRDTEPLSPFQCAFLKCLESTETNLGWGVSLLDVTTSEAGDSVYDYLKSMRTKISSEQLFRSTIIGQQVAVDCFGNIAIIGSNHQFIAMPGCLNPFTWVRVDENGNDVGSPGDYYNIINSLSMSQNDNDVLHSGIFEKYQVTYTLGTLTATMEGDTYDEVDIGSAGIAVNATKPIKVKKLKMEFNDNILGSPKPDGSGNYPLRVVYGDSQTTTASGALWWTDGTIRDYFRLGKGDTEKDGYISAVQYFLDNYPDDWSLPLEWADFGATWEHTSVQVTLKENGDYSGYADSVPYLDALVFIDNLGVFEDQAQFNALNVATYMDKEGMSEGTSTLGDYSIFSNRFSDVENGNILVPDSLSETALASLYSTYLFASMYDDTNKKDSIGKLGYRVARDTLPSIPSKKLTLNVELLDEGLEAIKNWVYYLLHPTQGFQYVTTLITNKVNHLLLKWHYDMTGTNGVGAITGTTTYRGMTGYVSMPDLSEIQWTDSLIEFYNNSIPFLIVVMIIIMLFAFITGMLKLQHSIIGVIIFSVFLLMPIGMINFTVDTSNRVSQSIYSEKFNYWALVQQESYASSIDEAANKPGSDGTSTYDNYLRKLLAENSEVYSNQGGESILLKWQAPRKFKAVGLSQQDASMMSGLSNAGKKLLLGALNNAYDGQSFTDNDSDTYLFRSYIDTGNIARYTYNGIKNQTREVAGFTGGVATPSDAVSASSNWTNTGLKNAIKNLEANFNQYRKDGFTGTNGDNSDTLNSTFYVTAPISSKVINNMLSKSGKLDTLDEIKTTSTGIQESSKVGLNPDLFSFSIPMFNNKNYKISGEDGFKNFCATLGISESDIRAMELLNYGVKNGSSYYSERDMTSLAAFALYTESPFYYFSWKLYNDGLDPTSSLTTGHYKDVVLKDNYFYNPNGGMNDFLDMKSLFTYIIPYLKQCNDMVREWDALYGCFLYEGIPTEEGHWDEVKDKPDMVQKYWHNLNVARLYSIYSPWVDIMYDCSYSKPEDIDVFGERVTIEDPLSPYSYPTDRPMIFSEAEMVYMGLSEKDLTAAEKLILKVNEDCQGRMYELLNYYNFSDVSMDTTAAMNCTFAFNIIFSETSLISDNKLLYPQSFDLPSFSYDAFLRLIIANNTGEDLLDTSSTTGTSTGNTTGDFYERVVNKSSLTTILVMLIVDVLSIYVIPMLRIFFVIAIFLASILIILSSAMKIESNVKFVSKVFGQFIMPLLKFLAVTVAFSYVISLFMGVGNNAVTMTENNSIQMGDPVMAMLLMAVIDVGCIILYWKILTGVLRSMRSDFRNVRSFATGAVTGVATMVAAGVGRIIHNNSTNNSVSNTSTSVNSTSYESSTVSPRASNRSSSKMGTVEESSLNNRFGSPKQKQVNTNNDNRINDYRAPIKPATKNNKVDSKERQDYSKRQLQNLDKTIDNGFKRLERAINRQNDIDDKKTKKRGNKK